MARPLGFCAAALCNRRSVSPPNTARSAAVSTIEGAIRSGADRHQCLAGALRASDIAADQVRPRAGALDRLAGPVGCGIIAVIVEKYVVAGRGEAGGDGEPDPLGAPRDQNGHEFSLP